MSPLATRHFTFRTFLLYFITCLMVVGFVWYVLFQARFLIAGPQISLTETATASAERQIVLEGSAENIVHISLNGRQIYTDTDGNFKEALVLENGYTIATLEAHDRYGRKTRLTETFVFTPQDDEQNEPVIN